MYGHQWRHFGAQYKNCQTDYTGVGVDQLAQVINTIKTNPNDRRIIMSAWNPIDLPSMALPPSVEDAQRSVGSGCTSPLDGAHSAHLTQCLIRSFSFSLLCISSFFPAAT